MKVLFVDCCMKAGEESRTKVLCNEFIGELQKEHPDYDISTVVLKDLDLKPYTFEMSEERERLFAEGKLDNPIFKYAKQFAEADRIIIGAPYWDLAFPAMLKIYIEHIFVSGITFEATENGLNGLCKVEKAIYIQTAGGFVGENNPGARYLKHVIEFMGAKEFKHVAAEFIDVFGVDVQAKLDEAKAILRDVAKDW